MSERPTTAHSGCQAVFCLWFGQTPTLKATTSARLSSFCTNTQPTRSARATEKHKRTLTGKIVRSTFQKKSWASESESRAWDIFIDFSLHKIASPSTLIFEFYRTSFTRAFKICPRDLKQFICNNYLNLKNNLLSRGFSWT